MLKNWIYESDAYVSFFAFLYFFLNGGWVNSAYILLFMDFQLIGLPQESSTKRHGPNLLQKETLLTKRIQQYIERLIRMIKWDSFQVQE